MSNLKALSMSLLEARIALENAEHLIQMLREVETERDALRAEVKRLTQQRNIVLGNSVLMGNSWLKSKAMRLEEAMRSLKIEHVEEDGAFSACPATRGGDCACAADIIASIDAALAKDFHGR